MCILTFSYKLIPRGDTILVIMTIAITIINNHESKMTESGPGRTWRWVKADYVK